MNEQKLEINKAEVNLLPLWRYEETVVMLESPEDAQAAAARLSEAAYIGIDTETKPTFRKGATPRPVALLQLALPDVVYLLRLNHYGLFDSIRAVLESESVEKVGIGTRDDVRELQRDFGCSLRGVVDLNTLCTRLGYKSIGARKLTALILGRRISKSQQTSDWEKPALTSAQIAYAATDAWICQAMYAKLQTEEQKPRRKRRRRRRRGARAAAAPGGDAPSETT